MLIALLSVITPAAANEGSLRALGKGASGADGFVVIGTTTFDRCEDFHVNLLVTKLPREDLTDVQGIFLANCGGGKVFQFSIDCLAVNEVDENTADLIASGYANISPNWDLFGIKSDTKVYVAFEFTAVDDANVVLDKYGFGDHSESDDGCNGIKPAWLPIDVGGWEITKVPKRLVFN